MIRLTDKPRWETVGPVPVTVVYVKHYSNVAPTSGTFDVTLLIFRDEQGGKYLWRASGRREVAPGTRYLLSGRVKAETACREAHDGCALSHCTLEVATT